MKIEALRSFSGLITMAAGEVRECDDDFIVNDLLQAGYVKEVKANPAKSQTKGLSKNGEPSEKTAHKKVVKKDESK